MSPPEDSSAANPPGRAVLSLGSNLPPRERWLDLAWETLAGAGAEVLASTPRWHTRALGGPSQPDYLNQLLLVRGALGGRGWLRLAQRAESRAGRSRTVAKGPRRLDVDVVLVEGETAAEADLTIPHPALLERPFLLAGTAALMPAAHLPGGTLSLAELAAARLSGTWAAAVTVRAAAGRPVLGSP